MRRIKFLVIVPILLSLFVTTHAEETGGDHLAFLPLVYRPVELVESPYEVTLTITPNGNINASTFEEGTFILQNTGTAGQVVSVTLDLSTAVLPDLVFDPNGNAGDTIAKDLSVDSGQFRTGYLDRQYASPHDGGGFDQLTLLFNSFDPDDTLTFSVDIDPTSIKGVAAPGPFESGSVAGIEMMGMTVHVLMADGASLSGQLTYAPSSVAGAQLILTEGPPSSPIVSVEGVMSPSTVSSANQTLIIEGTPFSRFQAAIVEAALFLDGTGFDIDPFEANSAVHVTKLSGELGASGRIELPIVLPYNGAGINHIIVWQGDANGRLSHATPVIILQLEP